MQKSVKIKYFLIAIILTLFILNIISSSYMSLSEDGAHYSLYGIHLNWGYIDHPPLIGWTQAALLFLFGRHDFVMHCSSFIFSIGIIYTIFNLSKELFPHQNNNFPYICTTALFLSGIFHILTILILTQNPLRFFCLLTCLFVWRLIKTKKNRYFILAGISLGFAGLSDYTAFLFALGLGLYIIVFARFLLKSKWLYVAITIAALMVSPFIIWNYNNHFMSFSTGAHRIVSHHWQWHSFFISLLEQLIAYSPALVIFSLFGLTSALVNKDKKQLLLAFPAILIILFFVISGGFHKINFHWPALGWILLVPIAINYMYKEWHRISIKIITICSIMLSIVVYGLFYFQLLAFPIITIAGKSPLYELYGWRQAAQHAITLADKLKITHQQPRLFVNHWAVASRIAWYSKEPVQIIPATSIAAYFQFIRWYGQPNTQANGIMVTLKDWSQPMLVSDEKGQFSHCNYLDNLPIIIDHQQVSEYNFYHCWGFNTDDQTKVH